jgi:hypothetical protein
MYGFEMWAITKEECEVKTAEIRFLCSVAALSPMKSK